MTINPDALYLLERSGQCYKVKSSDLSSVGTAGDLLLCNSGGVSYKVEFSRWNDIPDASLLLTNLNSQSYSVTGAQVKADSLGPPPPPPLPDGARYVSFAGTNESGQSYMAVNNNTGDSYGTNGSQSGAPLMSIYLRINNVNQWWSVGDVFVFYWVSSGGYSASVSANPAAMDRNSVSQQIGTGWGYSGVDTPFTIVGAEESVVPFVRFTITSGTGIMAFASTKVNGITAGTGAGSGSLPGFRASTTITNQEGKVLMAPKVEWIYPDGTLIYPELQADQTGFTSIPQNTMHTWMEPGYGTERTDVVGETVVMGPIIEGAVIPNSTNNEQESY